MRPSYRPMLRTREALDSYGRNSRPATVTRAVAAGFLAGVIFGGGIVFLLMLQFIA